MIQVMVGVGHMGRIIGKSQDRSLDQGGTLMT